MQNIPRKKDIKNIFVASPGKVLVQLDYSQCIARDTWAGNCRIQDHPDAISKGFADTVIVSTGRGYNVECTKDHQILTQRGWVKAQDIVTGDWLALEGKSVACTSHSSRDWFKGFFVGDGSFHNSPGTLNIALGIEEDRVELENMITEATGEAPRIYNNSQSFSVTNQRQLVDELHDQFNKKDLRIPFDADINWASFLSGLFDADGNTDSNGIFLATKYVEFAKDIQVLLLRYGVMSTIVSSRAGFNLVEGGADIFKVAISDQVSVDNFNKLIGFRLSRKVLLAKDIKKVRAQGNYIPTLSVDYVRTLNLPYRKFILNFLYQKRYYTRKLVQSIDDEVVREACRYHWDQVSTVEDSGRNVEVFDLMDQPETRFIANGVVVHNCELRALAVLSDDEWLKQVYYDDKDLHDAVALEMYGPGFNKEQRVMAKTINFGELQVMPNQNPPLNGEA